MRRTETPQENVKYIFEGETPRLIALGRGTFSLNLTAITSERSGTHLAEPVVSRRGSLKRPLVLKLQQNDLALWRCVEELHLGRIHLNGGLCEKNP